MTQDTPTAPPAGPQEVSQFAAHTSPTAALAFLLACGVDETLQDTAVDRFALAAAQATQAAAATQAAGAKQTAQATHPNQNHTPRPTLPPSSPFHTGHGQGQGQAQAHRPLGRAEAQQTAAQATTVAELRDLVKTFAGCPYKTTATHPIFAQGPDTARVVFIGDNPSADEDRSGQALASGDGPLFDKMLASLGRADLTREAVGVSYLVPWRPPGDLPPNQTDLVTMTPFTHRYLQLVKPDVVILWGGTVAKTLMQRREGITRLRGTWGHIRIPATPTTPTTPEADQASEAAFTCLPTYHPRHLLATPAAKREAWHDMLNLKEALESG